MDVIKGAKEESLRLRRLAKNASGDSARPILAGLHVRNGATWATDGFRAVAVPTPDCLADREGQTLDPNPIPAGDFLAEAEAIEGEYPAIDQVMPEIEGPSIILNASFLRDICELAGTNTPIRLTITTDERGQNMAVLQTSEDGAEPLYAVVMPMHDRGATRYEPEWD